MADLDPLILLKDIHLGPTISAWPPAWGWLGLIIFVMVGLGLIWMGWTQWIQKRWPVIQALLLLAEIEKKYAGPEHHAVLVQETNLVLKRYIKFKSPKDIAMQTFGPEWLEFLESKVQGLDFKNSALQVLATGGYNPHVQVEVGPFMNQVKLWLKRSRL